MPKSNTLLTHIIHPPKEKEEERKIERKILLIKNNNQVTEFINNTDWEYRDSDEIRFRYFIQNKNFNKAITPLARLKNKVINSKKFLRHIRTVLSRNVQASY